MVSVLCLSYISQSINQPLINQFIYLFIVHHKHGFHMGNGNYPRVSGGGQVDRDTTGKMSSRHISGKWASAGTRLKRLRRTGGAGGTVSPNASLTRVEPGTRNLAIYLFIWIVENDALSRHCEAHII